jgi:hypothetical protein
MLRVRCSSEGRCEGTATLVGVGPNHGIRLGQARFDLKPATSTLLSIPLSAAARRLLTGGHLTVAGLEGVGIKARRIKLS